MTTKRTPATGDTIEVLENGRWRPRKVLLICGPAKGVSGPIPRVQLGRGSWMDLFPNEWRWPGEAVDGSKRGRPRTPDGDLRRDVKVGLTPAERGELEEYAAREKAPLSAAIRDAALRAARWKP